ncbi:DUF1836 domain-containing protein [Cellulosilyticum lentocellum]|uniref:DUF1836 domain-containing protein n=1 Tax=Cellulosilyticum lentocellum (strain ATCC 49066 / DSM 5427 / NCIMB 11756 / RHM5) TaxID=642492 RepID=F2JN07_CELLD|nr:DUF1836 domain-containing protein [Cellulosilyticum lentocellum]ADZ82349.1 Domain of unknown function DUF1836 [Cellulosilyticum lentocellum DSM 5427]
MENKEINKIIETLKLDEVIEPQSIPNLDLYMDQVITLFEEKLAHTKRNEEDKLLTKTMINNYAKDKLLMPAKKKKYTREHIILMILLYEMKQILTISDIKTLFGIIVKEDRVDAKKLEEIYQIYLTLKKKGIDDFKEQVEKVKVSLNQQLEESNLIPLELKQVGELDSELAENIEINEKVKPKIEDMLMVIMLTQRANYYKRLAERIIDEKIKVNEL